MRKALDVSDKSDTPFIEVLIYSERDGKRWKMPEVFRLGWQSNPGQFRIVGIEHPS